MVSQKQKNPLIVSYEQALESKIWDKNFYLLIGEEAYQKEEILRKIEDSAIGRDKMGKLNLNVFYGETVEPATVIETTRIAPMFSKKRLIVLRNFDLIHDSGRKEILKYAGSVPESSCLVIISEETKTKGFINYLDSGCVLIAPVSMSSRDLMEWVRKQFAKHKKYIDDKAIMTLLEKTGDSTSDLKREIDKVLLFTSDEDVVRVENVDAVVGDMREFNVYEVIEYLCSRNMDSSLHAINKMLDDGVEPTSLVFNISRNFIDLWNLKNYQEKKMKREAVLIALKFNPADSWKLTKLENQASGFSKKELKDILRNLMLADLHLKTKDKKLSRTIIEKFVCQTAR